MSPGVDVAAGHNGGFVALVQLTAGSFAECFVKQRVQL